MGPRNALVLLTADIREIQGFHWHAATTVYVDAVSGLTGAIPVIVPASSELDVRSLLSVAHGVVATGSRSNVHPSNYGVDAAGEYEPYDVGRDSMSLPLLRAAVEAGIPVLAICRGMQELNVVLGGTLETEIQNKSGRMDHRAPVSDDQDQRFAKRHSIELLSGGILAKLFGERNIQVNSLHRQAIADLAPSLRIDALAPDGVIEAVSGGTTKGFVLGVQWHPEYWALKDTSSRKIFELFGEAVQTYQSEYLTTAAVKKTVISSVGL
jgi:putative glutamine amidotransferase